MGSQPETAPGSPAKKKQAEKTPGNPLTGAQGWNWAVTGVEPGTPKKRKQQKRSKNLQFMQKNTLLEPTRTSTQFAHFFAILYLRSKMLHPSSLRADRQSVDSLGVHGLGKLLAGWTL